MAKGKPETRNAEWLLVRKTAALGDLVDETMFMEMCGCTSLTMFRNWSRLRGVHGVAFPVPIFRPDGMKPIWLKSEATKFAREYKAKKATRSKK